MTSDVPTPKGLYAVSALLGEWTPTEVLSYRETLDARTYQAAARAGLRTPRERETARQRALHDHAITRALMDAIEGRNVIAFMGGHTLERNSEPYKMVAEIARSLATLGYLVVSGGGPGAMEAAHLGARLSCRPTDLVRAIEQLRTAPTFPTYTQNAFLDKANEYSFNEQLLSALHAWQAPAFRLAGDWPEDSADPLSIGIPTWLYGHEPPTPLASMHAKYFENSIREDGLLAIAKAGVVYAPGSAGTLQEVFQDAAQNYYKSVDDTRSPMVFLDLSEYWSVQRPVKLLLEGLFDESAERFLHFVTDAESAVTAIATPDGE